MDKIYDELYELGEKYRTCAVMVDNFLMVEIWRGEICREFFEELFFSARNGRLDGTTWSKKVMPKRTGFKEIITATKDGEEIFTIAVNVRGKIEVPKAKQNPSPIKISAVGAFFWGLAAGIFPLNVLEFLGLEFLLNFRNNK